MGNEAELKRIRMLEKRDEQEAEIRRLSEEYNFQIKEEEIKRLLQKDLQDYELKKIELDIRSRDINNQHESTMQKINKEHEKNITHENNRHNEELEKIKNDAKQKSDENERLKIKDKLDAENTI